MKKQSITLQNVSNSAQTTKWPLPTGKILSVRVKICRARAYEYLKQYDKAIRDYTRAIKLNPKSDELYNNRGACYKQLMKFEKVTNNLNLLILRLLST